MPNFALAQTVSGNVRALRLALGSAVRPLSLNDLAGMISDLHPARRSLNGTTVGRWEAGDSEPDLASLHIMANLAGVSMEQFAAVSAQTAPVADGGTVHHKGVQIDLTKPLTPAPDPRKGRAKAVKGTPIGGTNKPRERASSDAAERPGKKRRPA